VWTFPGQIFTFFRGCTDDGKNGVTEGGGFKEYVRVCTTHLCNDWDGLSSGPSSFDWIEFGGDDDDDDAY